MERFYEFTKEDHNKFLTLEEYWSCYVNNDRLFHPTYTTDWVKKNCKKRWCATGDRKSLGFGECDTYYFESVEEGKMFYDYFHLTNCINEKDYLYSNLDFNHSIKIRYKSVDDTTKGDILIWCKEYIKGKFTYCCDYYGVHIYLFEYPEDAMLFKITWSKR